MPRPLIASIDLPAMQSNLELAREKAHGAKTWAIVKANAYGHGLENGLRAFKDADGLGLIETDGAVQLRASGWSKPILLLEGFFEPVDLRTIAEFRLDFVVHCEEQLQMLESSRELAAKNTPFDLHLKLNSGMNRLGFTPAVFRSAYQRLRALPWVGTITFMTHFANADDDANPVLSLDEQLRRTREAIQGLDGRLCMANSAAGLLHPELAADAIRPGIMLYGGTPDPHRSAAAFGLLPAMTLTSELIGVQDVPPGEAVGYGSIFTADKPLRIGVVACGYADGYPRHAPTGTPILVDGVRTRVVGRVSMDMLAVDLGPVPHARVGTGVTLWGAGLPIDDVAQAAGTIGYELMCALAPRVRRVVNSL